MRRSVGRSASQQSDVAGRVTAGAITLVGLMAGWVGAGDGDGPELTPPSEMAITSRPANPTQTPASPPTNLPPKPSTTPARERATLALPGLTSPVNRPTVVAEPTKPTAGPSLDGPLEMGSVPEPLGSSPGTISSRPGRSMVLESTPIEEMPPVGSSSKDQSTSKKPTPPSTPAQSPARRPRIFGFLGPAPAPVRSAPAGRAVAGDSLTPTDPAAESALKRRIEKQARDAVGNRARSVEVRLEGKDATIHVTGAKLFQKRALRKQLESIPALSGLRSTIEINE